MRASTLQRRDAILEAALDCFDELGYELASVQDIRARSGASVGSIYHHFGGKEQIAAALFVGGIESYQRALTGVKPLSAERWVQGLVGAHVRWCARNRKMARFLDAHPDLEVRLAAETSLQELNRDFFAFLHATLKPWQQSGEITVLPLELFAAVVTGPAQAFTRRWLGRQTTLSLREGERLLATAAWGAVHT